MPKFPENSPPDDSTAGGLGAFGFLPFSGESESVRVMKRTFLTWLFVLSLSACGDDDDEGRPVFRAGLDVPGGTVVADLPERDLDRICQSYDAYVDTNISFEAIAYIACLPQAIVLSGGNSERCEQRLADCTALAPDPITVQAQVRDRDVCYSTLRECSASVVAFEGCVNVNLDLALDILDNWTCGGADDLRDRAQDAMDTVSVCADLDAACADFASPGPD
jgi:hypothetical protein